MPWAPELFSAPVLQRLQDKWDHELVTVPFFDGLMTGEVDALVGSFAGEPELHHPVRGRIKGVGAFVAFVEETRDWLAGLGVVIEDGDHVIRAGQRACGEVVLHVDGESGRVGIPVAIVADRQSNGLIGELRMYFSGWSLTGNHANRPPVMQRDPELSASAVLAEHQQALSFGDVDAIVATFERDGYVREPAGPEYVHRGPAGLRDFYERLFASGGGIGIEQCSLIEDDRACALEYNLVRWGNTELSPEAGVAVYVRGESGKIAAARIYDDVTPPPAQR